MSDDLLIDNDQPPSIPEGVSPRLLECLANARVTYSEWQAFETNDIEDEMIILLNKYGVLRPPNVSNSRWEAPTKISPRDRRLIDLIALGRPKDEIAIELGMSSNRINQIINAPMFRARIASKQNAMFENNAKSYMKTLMNKAYAVIEDLLENAERETVRLDAAKFVVDHVVGKATNTTEIKGTILVDIMNRLDLMKRDGPVIEAKILASPDEPAFVNESTDPLTFQENVTTAAKLIEPFKDTIDSIVESLDFETSIIGERDDGKGS